MTPKNYCIWYCASKIITGSLFSGITVPLLKEWNTFSVICSVDDVNIFCEITVDFHAF